MTDDSVARKSILSGVTVETAIYVALAVGALLLRLVDLDSRPLSDAEAARALDAWRLVHGQTPSTIGSPLLLHGTSVVFFLFGANDFTARLLPALFGSAMVLLPLFWRKRLGRASALISAGLLAFSPLALFYSRYVGPEILVAASALGLLTGIIAFSDSQDGRYLSLTAVSLALLLASGPGAYFVILIAVIAAIVAWAASPRAETPFVERLREALGSHSASLRTVAILFGATIVAVGTFALLDVPGLQGFGDVLTEWWAGFTAVPTLPWFGSILWPALYEPAVLVFGLVGGIVALRRRARWASLLLGSALGIAVLLTAYRGRTAGDFLLVTVPLALLAGKELASLLGTLREHRLSAQDGLFFAVFAILMVYLYLQVSGFVDGANGSHALLAWVALGLVLALTVGQSLMYGLALAGRNLGIGVGAVALLVTLSAAMGVGYDASQKSIQLLDPLPTSPAVRRLAADLRMLSLQRLEDQHELPVTIVSAEPSALSWYLQDMHHLEIQTDAGSAIESDAVVTDETVQPTLEGAYTGQAYDLQTDARWRTLAPRDFWGWVLYRQYPSVPYHRVILWFKAAGST